MKNLNFARFTGSSILALGAALTALPAAAQTTPAGGDGQPVTTIQEIIVTAQKRSENLQSVPVAVTAITSDQIANSRIENIADLRSVAPNLYVVTQPGGNAIPSTMMRGQVSGAASNPTVDNGISYYIDGVYLGSLSGIIFDVADIERIEVIRGPAGTLFGTNSTGGAINYITSGPRGVFAAKQDFSYARFGSFRSKTRIDLPEWHGISAAVSYLHNEKRNNVRNFDQITLDYSDETSGKVGALTSVKRLGESTTDAVHATVRWKPLDDLTIDYKFDWSRQEFSPPPVYLLGFPDTPGGIAAYQLVASQVYFGGPTLDDYIQTERGKAAFNNTTTKSVTKTISHLIVGSYRANEHLTIKNTTSWRSLDRNAFTSDLDGTGTLTVPIAYGPDGSPTVFAPLSPLSVRCCNQLRQFSNELQFNVDTRPVAATAGLFYYTRRTPPGENPFGLPVVDTFQVFPGNAHPGTPITDFDRSFYFKVRQVAGYGQATWHATDQIDVTGGIRYTQDDKTFFDTSAGEPGSTYTYSKGNFSYLANLTYKPSRDLLLYAKYVTSFIAGGTAAGPLAVGSVTGKVFQGPAIPYKEERAVSWEGGLKADWLGHRLRTNLALFHVRYSNLQTPIFASSGCVTSPSGICEPIVSSQYTANFGKARAFGLEFEVTAIPIENLTLSASGSMTDFKYLEISPEVLASGGVSKVSDYPETIRPTFMSNLSAEYVQPLDDGMRLALRVEGALRSKIVVGTSAYSSAGFEAAGLPYDNDYMNAANTQKALLTLNARLSLMDVPLGPTTATVSLWGRNLTNKQQINMISNTGVTAAVLFDDPVTYGIDLSIKL